MFLFKHGRLSPFCFLVDVCFLSLNEKYYDVDTYIVSRDFVHKMCSEIVHKMISRCNTFSNYSIVIYTLYYVSKLELILFIFI